MADIQQMYLRKQEEKRLKSYLGSSDLTEEKRLQFWLAPIDLENCEGQPQVVFHDKLTHSKHKHYLQSHPFSKQRLLACKVPSSVKYSPQWFVKMIPAEERNLDTFTTFYNNQSASSEGSQRIGGGGGNDVPIGRSRMSEPYFSVLRKRYTNSKHGVAMSKRAIAAKTVTATHRSGLVSSWEPFPENDCHQ